MGRWLSPDWSAKAEPVPYAKLDNPQSLNLYTYALNNPLTNVDRDGHEATWEIDRKNKTIKLTVNITVYGPGANAAYAKGLQSAIDSAWSGKVKVGDDTYSLTTSAHVSVYDAASGVGAENKNWLYVATPGSGGGSEFDGRAGHQDHFGRWTGRVDPAQKPERHEAGHMLGLGDDYYEDTQRPLPGPGPGYFYRPE
jgi:hypothetical protein